MRRSSSLSPEACEHQLNIWSCLVLAGCCTSKCTWTIPSLAQYMLQMCYSAIVLQISSLLPLLMRKSHLYEWGRRLQLGEKKDLWFSTQSIVICFLAEIVGDTEDVCKYIKVNSRLNNDNVRQWAIVNRGIGVVKGWELRMISSFSILVISVARSARQLSSYQQYNRLGDKYYKMEERC